VTARTRWPGWADGALVTLAALAAFLPGIFGEFVLWDDDRNFVENPAYRGLGWPQLAWMLTTFHMGHWKPLTWLTLGLDYTLWGMDPRGYHLTSLLLHAGAALAFLLVARRLLTAALPALPGGPLRVGAAGAALLFAVHPLRAESVVWITERRDVLSGLLYLLTVLAYLRAVGQDGVRTGRVPAWRNPWYGAALGLFTAALLAKSIVATLPLVLLILDVYPLRRLGGQAGWAGPGARRAWVEKLPFLALGAAASAVAFAALLSIRNAQPLGQFGLWERAAVSLHGLGFYLWKSLWPAGLSPIYELRLPVDPVAPAFLGSGGAVLALALLAVALRRRLPGVPAVLAAYGVTLLPVLGVFQNGPQIAADRYSYLAGLGWALLAGAGLARGAATWVNGAPRRGLAAAALAAGAGAVILLAALSARQARVWQDSETLWTHAVRVDSGSAVAWNGLAMALLQDGRVEDAARHFERALAIDGGAPEAHMGLAFTLVTGGRGEEAAAHARAALARRPHDPRYHAALADVLRGAGRRDEALAALERAVALDPGAPGVRYGLALALAELGRMTEARAAWRRYLAGPSAVRNPAPREVRRMLLGLAVLRDLEADIRDAHD
jgi:protein O-mannosyl-transferase